MPVLLYYMMGFWVPEIALTVMYLFVMRKPRKIPTNDLQASVIPFFLLFFSLPSLFSPLPQNPLKYQYKKFNYKTYHSDSTTDVTTDGDDSRSSGSEDPHYFLDAKLGGGMGREEGGRRGGRAGSYDFFEPLTLGGDTRVLPVSVSQKVRLENRGEGRKRVL